MSAAAAFSAVHEVIGSAGAAEPALFSLRGIGKTFSTGTTALGALDLDVGEGEFVSLLGPSGCGKSTALRIIAGLLAPSRGRIEWRGQGTGLAEAGARAEVGFVFQEPTLLPWADVVDNVWLPLRLRGLSRAKAMPAVTAMLERVGLGAFAHAMPRELSGGMRMRVSIARALVTRPRLLLMDEPFAALDEITRFSLNDDLIRLWRDARFTAVFVTHSVFESVFLSNRVVVMAAHPGRVFGELRVEAKGPRDAGFRMSADYLAQCRRASDLLAAAMGAKPAGASAAKLAP